MSLSIDDLADHPPTKPNHLCGFCWVLTLLPDEQSDKLRVAVDNPGITVPKIVSAIRNAGHDISPASVDHHRTRKCKARRTIA